MRKQSSRNDARGTEQSAAGSVEGGSVRAVERALAIVRLLAEERRSLGITDIAGALALPHATVHRLLMTLVDQRWVERSRSTSRYRLGPGILGTTAIALAHAPLLERGRPILQRVASLAGADAYLSALVGRRVAFLEHAVGAGEGLVGFHPGITQPAHCTSSGKALVAFLPEADRRFLFRDPGVLRRYTPATIIDLTAFEHELAAVRHAGYAEDHGEFVEAWRSVAVPVAGADGVIVAAMSCGGPAGKMTPEAMQMIRGELLVQADELSRQLGLHED